MGRVCGTYGGELNSGFWWGNLREREHLGDTGVEGRILLKRTFHKLFGIVEWINWAQDMEEYRADINGDITWSSVNVGNY
jgi:hypothetical protein